MCQRICVQWFRNNWCPLKSYNGLENIFLRRLFFGFYFLMPTIEHERMDNLLVIALLKDRSYALIIEL